MSGHSDAYGTEVFNDTPIAYWRFDGDGVDEMAGTSMTLTNGAAATGATLVSTYSGAAALDVDGTNDYASVADDNKFDFTFNLSLEAWFKADTLTGSGGIVGKFDWGIGHVDATLRVFCWFGTWVFYNWATTMSTNTLYHVVSTYDGANVRLYLNGVQDASTARTAQFNVNAKPVEVGSWDISADWFDGLIDEVAVYNRALTAQEVADHYTVGTGGSVGAKSAPIRRRPARGLILR